MAPPEKREDEVSISLSPVALWIGGMAVTAVAGLIGFLITIMLRIDDRIDAERRQSLHELSQARTDHAGEHTDLNQHLIHQSKRVDRLYETLIRKKIQPITTDARGPR